MRAFLNGSSDDIREFFARQGRYIDRTPWLILVFVYLLWGCFAAGVVLVIAAIAVNPQLAERNPLFLAVPGIALVAWVTAYKYRRR